MQSSTASPASASDLSESPTISSGAHVIDELVAKHGESQRGRIQRGVRQVTEFWRVEDGDDAAFQDFVRASFAGDQATLDAIFDRLERMLEQLGGHMHEISREFRQQLDLDLGPFYPFDEIIGGYDPSAHVTDDFFRTSLPSLCCSIFRSRRWKSGSTMDRHGRAGSGPRRASRKVFSKRIPADVNLAIAKAEAESGQYISGYNIWMHHLLDAQGQRLFPPKMRLLEPLEPARRDQSRLRRRGEWPGQAANDPAGDGAHRRRRRFPHVVVDNPDVDWNPFTNAVTARGVEGL